jgi:hypothetical protein
LKSAPHIYGAGLVFHFENLKQKKDATLAVASFLSKLTLSIYD